MDKSLYGSERACKSQDLAPARDFGQDAIDREPLPYRGYKEQLPGVESVYSDSGGPILFYDGRDTSSQIDVAGVLKNTALVSTPTNVDIIRDRFNLNNFDFEPFRHRHVIIWFGADLEGEILAERFARHLEGIAVKIDIIRWPERWRRQQFFNGELAEYFDDFFDYDLHRNDRETWRDLARNEFAKLVEDSRMEGAF